MVVFTDVLTTFMEIGSNPAWESSPTNDWSSGTTLESTHRATGTAAFAIPRCGQWYICDKLTLNHWITPAIEGRFWPFSGTNIKRKCNYYIIIHIYIYMCVCIHWHINISVYTCTRVGLLKLTCRIMKPMIFLQDFYFYSDIAPLGYWEYCRKIASRFQGYVYIIYIIWICGTLSRTSKTM